MGKAIALLTVAVPCYAAAAEQAAGSRWTPWFLAAAGICTVAAIGFVIVDIRRKRKQAAQSVPPFRRAIHQTERSRINIGKFRSKNQDEAIRSEDDSHTDIDEADIE